MQGAVVGCVGGLGGVAFGIFARSKNSVMSGCAASRAVRLGRLNLVSINFKMAVVSITVCETYPFLVNGDTTSIGILKPVRE